MQSELKEIKQLLIEINEKLDYKNTKKTNFFTETLTGFIVTIILLIVGLALIKMLFQ